MSRQIRTLVCLCALTCATEAARVLAVFPTPSISHQVVFRPLTQELARQGHQVVVITTHPEFSKGQTPANFTEIDVHDVSLEMWSKLKTKFNIGNKNDIATQFGRINEQTLRIFEKQIAASEVNRIIENNTFDMLLVEAWTRFALGFSHVVKGPVVAVSSFYALYDNYDVMGAPTHSTLYTRPVVPRLHNLSLWEKITQMYHVFSLMKEYKYLEVNENIVVRSRFGDDTPDLSELQNNVDMLLLNVHPLWEGIRPVPPGVVHIDGLHQKSEKDLPQDLKQFLDNSVHGVIYLSFGTNIDMATLPSDKIQAFINVLSQLPYDVLWKWKQDELPGRTKNIMISKWFPQFDLLRHPNMKLFITQGGQQSTDETITAGVPVIAIPFLCDQFVNAEKYEHFNIGKKIYIHDLDEETLKSAIKTVIEDESYRKNIVRLRTLMNDKPYSSLDRAVFWAKHALRGRQLNTRHLRPLRAPAAHMGWAQYFEIELMLIVICATVTILLMLSKLAKLAFRLVVNNDFFKKVL